MLWWLMQTQKLETIRMSNAKIAMVKTLQNQEIFKMIPQIKIKIFDGKILKIIKDILEIPLDGTDNSDGWSIVKPIEAIYIEFN